ncbi:MAG: hypothetical protein COX35_00250 [Candidatus Nealsonbacteria bacterium CG23_combo_of_CG06-09_8_20_14_all_37_18]|uniref:General secretion pathway GspH domain-containing protein n=1 Tax=Candidatus Nealsonbacteria bacterium CG23_combo_of_CG06-09_8_20_14_all_37_18 TaxID=1974720 RepID=A0A2G9YZ29_9BACT|nr:MAG: hypothetical protein COX35_00250 [Candidatus Nealsonbacteria bacterium CG23_combo_of_CG06-09_8_20_14_all_37_18]
MNKAFTLIEILVVIGIIISMTALISPNYKVTQTQLALLRSAQKLSHDLRRAEAMAMSAKEIGEGIVPAGQEFYPTGGYGIYLILTSPSNYILFADCDNNKTYTTGNVCGPVGYQFPELIETISLESGVTLSSFSTSSPLNIAFSAPDPTVTITPTSAQATITLIADSRTKTVEVNTAGLISNP